MLQVCSQCGTRWNVRDRQRVWCPRCNGTLLAPDAPSPPSPWSARSTTAPARPDGQHTPPRLPTGYRWIAVRPGAAPPTPHRRRQLGPTPRYRTIPRWGLVEQFDPAAPETAPSAGPTGAMVRATLIPTMLVLGMAAAVHIVRYVLLLINRNTLLNPWVAGLATWLGVAISVLALFAVVASLVMLTNWLIARRAAAYARLEEQDPRPRWVLRVGCLVPFVNLAWAPVFVVELARLEGRYGQLRRPIIVWWILWLISYVVSVWSIVTSFTTDAQGIADNTITTTIAYLAALATLVLTMEIFLGFDRVPVERPARRWVVIADERGAPDRDDVKTAPHPTPDGNSDVAVESRDRNPAA